MTSMTHESTGNSDTQKKAVDGAHELASRVHSTVDRAAALAHSAADQVSTKTGEWIHTQDRLLAGTREYIREQPMMALGIALAVGFLLSRITR
jgi:ElaB/YqjD/DUF883 family membrane-anchored ribosome-binding protein